MAILQLFGVAIVGGFGGGQVPQKLARRGVARAGGGAGVERLGRLLHRLRFAANRVQRQVLRQPDRTAGVEPGDMFAADQGDHLAKAGAVQVDQALAVTVLFHRHAVEHLGRGRKVRAQALGKAAVDAGVILFRRDRQGQNLLFGQIGKAATVGQGGQHEGAPFLE